MGTGEDIDAQDISNDVATIIKCPNGLGGASRSLDVHSHMTICQEGKDHHCDSHKHRLTHTHSLLRFDPQGKVSILYFRSL